MRLLILFTLLVGPLMVSAEECTTINESSRRAQKRQCSDGTVVGLDSACPDGSEGTIISTDR